MTLTVPFVDYKLLAEIDSGESLVNVLPDGNSVHLAYLPDVIRERLVVIAQTHGFDLDLQSLTPSPGYDDWCLASRILFRASFYHFLPPEFQAAYMAYLTELDEQWIYNWDDPPSSGCKRDDYWLYFHRLYQRYKAYVELRGDVAIPWHAIWIEPKFGAVPGEDLCLQFEMELEDRYPLSMRYVECCLNPHVAKRTAFRATYSGEPTDWTLANEEVHSAEHALLLKSVEFKSIRDVVDDALLDALRKDVLAVKVEYRYRDSKSDLNTERSEKNIKRSRAALVRYIHPKITRDVVDTVVRMHRKTQKLVTPREDVAPTRAVCVHALLFVHNVPNGAWPSSFCIPRTKTSILKRKTIS